MIFRFSFCYSNSLPLHNKRAASEETALSFNIKF
nr:MAG TPA: hypothetical protein [Caudoviricetes sp.]